MNIESLRGKRIGLLGLGREGLATFRFLIKNGIVPDAVMDKAEPSTEVIDLLSENGVKTVFGDQYLEGLERFDLIFRSPGIPRLHPKLARLPNQESITSQTRLFFDLCPAKIIGVTGTKGKTTTSTLIYEIIRASGKHVLLGGNVGEPALNLIDGLDKDSIAVLELSSFQLQDLTKSPEIAVLLNVTHDHVDDKHTFKAASHDSLEEYIAAKQRIILHQGKEDFAVLSEQLPESYLTIGEGKKIIAKAQDARRFSTKLIGAHNLSNIAAAASVAKILEIPEQIVGQAIENFEPIQHRLKVVSINEGITYVDDSASTDVDSSLAAIDAFPGPLIMILGGSDKNLDYMPLGEKIRSSGKVKGVVVIGQVGERILETLKGFTGKISTGAKDMREIVEQAKSMASPGDIVLLSPAAASFDMFKDAKDRGDQFINLVR